MRPTEPIQDSGIVLVDSLQPNLPGQRYGFIRLGGTYDRATDWTVYIVRELPQLDGTAGLQFPVLLEMEIIVGHNRGGGLVALPNTLATLWARGTVWHFVASEINLTGIYNTTTIGTPFLPGEVTRAWVAPGRPASVWTPSYVVVNAPAVAPYPFTTQPQLYQRIPTFATRLRVSVFDFANLGNYILRFYSPDGINLSSVPLSLNVGNGVNDYLSTQGGAVPPWATYVALEDTTLLAPAPNISAQLMWECVS
jgi:hypothetical protein